MAQTDFSYRSDIHAALKRYRAEPHALLIDVRAPREYREGHIPGAVCLPLTDIEDAEDIAPDKQTPLYLYCLTGSRSRQAAITLQEMGYEQAYDIGGVSAYEGELDQSP